MIYVNNSGSHIQDIGLSMPPCSSVPVDPNQDAINVAILAKLRRIQESNIVLTCNIDQIEQNSLHPMPLLYRWPILTEDAC